MKAFEYASPRTEAEVLQLLSAEPGATEVLAGGTDLVGLMKKMIVTPERVVNIMDVPSLKTIDELPDIDLRLPLICLEGGGVSERERIEAKHKKKRRSRE